MNFLESECRGFMESPCKELETSINPIRITIRDNTSAVPYPSLRSYNELGNAGDFAVFIEGIKHTYPGDILMMLVAPDGRCCLLMKNSCNAFLGAGTPEVNLVFRAGYSALPQNSAWSSGTYGESVYTGSGTYPATYPWNQTLYSLVDLATSPKLEEWSLYVYDDTAGDQGYIRNWGVNFNP